MIKKKEEDKRKRKNEKNKWDKEVVNRYIGKEQGCLLVTKWKRFHRKKKQTKKKKSNTGEKKDPQRRTEETNK